MLDRGDRAPAGACRDCRGRLLAAPRGGEDGELRVLLDDLLAGELRVAAAGRVRGVGDVPEAEELVDAADERLRRGGVVRRVELVVDAQVAPQRRDALDDRGDLR